MIVPKKSNFLFRFALCLAWAGWGGLVFWGCGTNPQTRAEKQDFEPVEMRYAKGFKLWKSTGVSGDLLLEIYDPRDTAGLPLYSYLLSHDTASSSKNRVTLPLENIALGSTTFAPFLQHLGQLDKIAGIGHGDRIMDAQLSARIRSGEVAELVSGERVELEKILAVAPDVFLANDFGEADIARISSMGIPTVVLTEYLEPHPLGRAEWLLLFGALTHSLDSAQKAFDRIEHKYNETMELVETGHAKPRVFAGSRYGDFWYAPGGDSYLAAFFRDAGADYVFAEARWAGNAQLDFEAALAAVADADYWGLILDFKGDFTPEDLRAMDARYAALQSFQTQKVFVCNTREADYFGRAVLEPHLVLYDLIRIFHADTVDTGYHYFEPLH